MSLVTPEEMDKICTLLKGYNISLFKITAGHHLALYDVTRQQVEAIRRELFTIFPQAPAIGVTYIHACPSIQECKYAIKSAHSLGRRIEQLSFDSPHPNKIKVGIAGCKMCCTEPFLRDIGIIGKRKGWTLVFGGNGGGRPRIGDIIGQGLDDDQTLELIISCIRVYRELATPRQRTARLLEQIGIDKFLNSL